MLPEEMFASDEDRADFENLERCHRWGTTSESLHVGPTGEMISPNGTIDDETIARLEARYRERTPPEKH